MPGAGAAAAAPADPLAAPAGVAGGLGRTVVRIKVTENERAGQLTARVGIRRWRGNDERVWKREKVAKGMRVT